MFSNSFTSVKQVQICSTVQPKRLLPFAFCTVSLRTGQLRGHPPQMTLGNLQQQQQHIQGIQKTKQQDWTMQKINPKKQFVFFPAKQNNNIRRFGTATKLVSEEALILNGPYLFPWPSWITKMVSVNEVITLCWFAFPVFPEAKRTAYCGCHFSYHHKIYTLSNFYLKASR